MQKRSIKNEYAIMNNLLCNKINRFKLENNIDVIVKIPYMYNIAYVFPLCA